MDMERGMPKSINYQDVLPVAVPAVARRRRFYPANGTTFNHTGSSEIRIEIGSVNSLLDVQHSYLQFVVKSTGGGAIAPDIGVPFIRRLRVGSAVISASLRFQQLYDFEGYKGKQQKYNDEDESDE